MIVTRRFFFVIFSFLLFIYKPSYCAYNVSISLRNNTVVQEYHFHTSANYTLHFPNDTIATSIHSRNHTVHFPNNTIATSIHNGTYMLRTNRIDCFGLGSAIAQTLHWFFVGRCKDCDTLDVKFYLSSRRQRHRVEVMVGKQFGLEWTDFQIERRTVLIVHGFLSHSNESWVKNLEDAFLLWGDVNVIVVDWSAGGNTWNYYKAVIYTRTVGQQITRFLDQIVNSTIASGNTNSSNWGPLHFVGHSLGAHICGFVCHNLKRIQDKWIIKRVTGLDPAQPCFTTNDLTMQLDRTDAQYVDVIHTNGRLLSRLGLGLPTPIGHTDFYPNGGMKQPGCVMVDSSFFSFLPFSTSKIRETICSHGRSYIYLTESLITAASLNCTFWAHHWDMTYRDALKALKQACTHSNCTEMGIRSEAYPHRGTFYVATGEQSPFCVGDTVINKTELIHLVEDLAEELED